jgi:hypothetical protein
LLAFTGLARRAEVAEIASNTSLSRTKGNAPGRDWFSSTLNLQLVVK